MSDNFNGMNTVNAGDHILHPAAFLAFLPCFPPQPVEAQLSLILWGKQTFWPFIKDSSYHAMTFLGESLHFFAAPKDGAKMTNDEQVHLATTRLDSAS